jgi:ferritin-like metal-binding protein YciE
MKHITNLNGLLTENLKSVYTAEKKQLEELPEIMQRVQSAELRQALQTHIANKRQNIDRLEQAFNMLDVPARGQQDKVTEDLLQKCKTTIADSAEGHVTDAGIISAVQQINHLNIANLGSASAHANALGEKKVAELLHKSLTAEKAVDRKLSTIAEETINPAAIFQH